MSAKQINKFSASNKGSLFAPRGFFREFVVCWRFQFSLIATEVQSHSDICEGIIVSYQSVRYGSIANKNVSCRLDLQHVSPALSSSNCWTLRS